MRIRFLPLLVLCLAASPAAGASRFRPGEVLVALPRGESLLGGPGARLRASDPAASRALESLGLHVAARLDALRRDAKTPAHGEYLKLRSDRADFDPVAASAALRATGAFRAACPNLKLKVMLTTPNDPDLSSQWHLGTSSAAIRARNAWDIQRGDSAKVIAILDTGVDTGHPDLEGKLWQNTAEIAGNSIDDDGNGLIDDRFGWDFGDGDNNPDPEPIFDSVVGIDIGWHGTFVAALAGAATNNATGVAGVSWGSKLMALKVADRAGDLPLDAVASAFDYALAEGASVINMSLGTPDTLGRAFFQALADDAVAAGVVCVAAAGNDGTDEFNFPAACESVLAVAATNPQNHRADFSNWGPYVDIAAPGEGMWSAIARNYEYDEFSALFFEILWGWDTVNPYMSNDGTSFSCPIAAGACALIRSQFPWMTPVQVMQQIVLRGDAVNYDNPIGPRLNLFSAVSAAALDAPAPVAASRAALLPASPNPAADGATIAFRLPADERVSLSVVDLAGRRVRSVASGPYPAGVHAVRWDGRDTRGARVAPGLYFVRMERAGGAEVQRLSVIH